MTYLPQHVTDVALAPEASARWLREFAPRLIDHAWRETLTPDQLPGEIGEVH